MSQIEKLYENARLHKCTNIGNFCKHIGATCERCKKHKYPPFTAEKQLELIKWLIHFPMLDEISLYFNVPSKTYNLTVYSLPEIGNFRSTYTGTQNSFDDMLAGLINNLWQSLTDVEKEQIKEILNG